ncbi:hypothetical protein KXS11_10175 [Plantibacter flavus]|uniref:hypothetical protein n=1 Tax=Plantibacter flavus TaxID=150123 RepID=UPI003F1439AC
MTDHPVDLSDAVVLFLTGFPSRNDDEFLAGVADEATRDAVHAILDETRRIPIEWGRKTLPEIGQEVRGVVRQRHPELTDTAVDRLGSYFTYLVK